MPVRHIEISVKAKERGFHLIDNEISAAVRNHLPENGLLTLFIKHTSAAITINENADSSVRDDFSSFFNRLVKENEPYYTHTHEGTDDMPAHLKASLIGNSLSIPIINGRLALGTWQGIYLCEFRNHAPTRKLIISILF